MSNHDKPRQPKGVQNGGQWRHGARPEGAGLEAVQSTRKQGQQAKVVPGGEPEARSHLRKATEYLSAAKRSLEAKEHDVTVGLAAIAGINAADAINLCVQGVRSGSASHTPAISLLRSSKAGAGVAGDLTQLLNSKNIAQYSDAEMSKQDALQAVQAAERILAVAEKTLTSNRRTRKADEKSASSLAKKLLGRLLPRDS
jgi:HEPN domain-containing protein